MPESGVYLQKARSATAEAWKIAVVSLGLLLFHSIFHYEGSFWLACFAGIALVGSFCRLAVSALINRSWPYFKPAFILGVSVALIIPVILLGGAIRERIILLSLPGFQRMTDQLIAKVPDFDHMKPNDLMPERRIAFEHVPIGWRWLVGDDVIIDRTKDGGVEVTFWTNDVGFIRKEIIYVSDDNPRALGAKRIAPRWYLHNWEA